MTAGGDPNQARDARASACSSHGASGGAFHPDCPLPVTPKDPAFHRCYVAVGDFPEVNVGAKWLYTRVLTAFGAGLVPIL